MFDINNIPSAKVQLATIAKISANASKLQEQIHFAGLNAMAHALQHGDATIMQALYNALPNGQRREALLVWCNKYSPIRVVQKGKKCGLLKEGVHKEYVPFDIEGAAASPYYNLDEKNGFKLDVDSMNFKAIVMAALKQKLKRLDKAIEADADESDAFNFAEGFDPTEARASIIRDAVAAGFTPEGATPAELIRQAA